MISDPSTPSQRIENPPPSFKPGRRGMWVLITCVIVLIVAIGAFLTLQLLGVFASSSASHPGIGVPQTATPVASTPNTTPATPNTTPATPGATTPTANPSTGSISPQQAVEVVSQYYVDINARDYQDAYNLWGSRYQRSTSYATFVNGFANTLKDVVQYGNAVTLSDGTVKVPVTLLASIPFGGSTTVNTYQGYYIVGLEDTSAKLLNADIQLTGSSNDRVQQAVATVNQYYADINAKDYQDAYNLWGTAYQQSTSYQQFVAGFAQTQSVSITLLPGIKVLREGSVEVPLTIHSVDVTNSGTVTHTYQGYYIVGTEGNSWQLFSASIQ